MTRLASGGIRVATEAEITIPELTGTNFVQRRRRSIVRVDPEAANVPKNAPHLAAVEGEAFVRDLALVEDVGTGGSVLAEGFTDIDAEPAFNPSAYTVIHLHGHFDSSVAKGKTLSLEAVAAQSSGYGLSYEPVGTAFEYAGLPQERDAWGSSATLFRPTVVPSAWEFTRSLGETSVGKQAKVLLASIQENWLLMQRSHPDASYLPKLHSHLVEDGSVLFEWVLPQLRLGFGLEEDPSVSGWFLVTGEELGSISASGHLERVHLPGLITWLLDALLSFS